MTTPYGPYNDGSGGSKHGDPLRIYRRLLTGLGPAFNSLLGRFSDLADDEARDKVVQAAGWAFELTPFDPKTGEGATEEQVEKTLRDFLEWLEGNASWVRTTPT